MERTHHPRGRQPGKLMGVGSAICYSTLRNVEPEEGRVEEGFPEEVTRIRDPEGEVYADTAWGVPPPAKEYSVATLSPHVVGTGSAQPTSPRHPPFCSPIPSVLHPHVPGVLHLRSKYPRSVPLGRGGCMCQLPMLGHGDSARIYTSPAGSSPDASSGYPLYKAPFLHWLLSLLCLSPLHLCWHFL